MVNEPTYGPLDAPLACPSRSVAGESFLRRAVFLSYDGRINILEIVIIIRMHYNHIYIISFLYRITHVLKIVVISDHYIVGISDH